MADANLIEVMGKLFAGPVLEKLAESRGVHVYVRGHRGKFDVFGKMLKKVIENRIDAFGVVMRERILLAQDDNRRWSPECAMH